ncbi:MAG: hypothetical protein V4615_09720, partial [Bacteroidota bacterium]
MKLLLCLTDLKDIHPALKEFSASLLQHPELKFLNSAKILNHEVDIVESGAGIYQTSYKVTKVLGKQKYHLALKI